VRRKILGLPHIELIESSDVAFSRAFLEAAHVLCQSFGQLNLLLIHKEDFANKLLYKIAMGLFTKFQRHYYSYILLETEHDFLGSQFLLEQIYKSATTLIYVLEEADEALLTAYVNQANCQADRLLQKIEQQLQSFPEHRGLSTLQEKLETIRTQNSTSFSGPMSEPAILLEGLDFFDNPTRSILLDVVPAAWLDIQLNYDPQTIPPARTSFTLLRDVGHLCLHASQSLMEEAVHCDPLLAPKVRSLNNQFTETFIWLHEAHNAYYRVHLMPDSQ
jgi:hypothetical protein